MSKPKISLDKSTQDIETHEGTVSLTLSQSQLMALLASNGAPKSEPKKGKQIDSIAKILGIVVSVIIIITAIGGAIWKLSSWKKENELKIEKLENIIKDLRKENKNRKVEVIENSDIRDNNTTQDAQQYSIDNHELSNEILTSNAQVGIINKKIIKSNSRTSFNLPYVLNDNICEYNLFYNNWSYYNPEPKPLFFYKLINSRNHLSAWCIVIGGFKGKDTPDRAFLVSEKLARDLGISLKKGVAIINFCRIIEKEWSTNEKCLKIRSFFFNQ